MTTHAKRTEDTSLLGEILGRYSIRRDSHRWDRLIPRPVTTADTGVQGALAYASSHPPHDVSARAPLAALPPCCSGVYGGAGVYAGTAVAWLALLPLERLALLLQWGQEWPDAPPPGQRVEEVRLHDLDWFSPDGLGDIVALVDRNHGALAALLEANAPQDAVEEAGQSGYAAADDPLAYPRAVKATQPSSLERLVVLEATTSEPLDWTGPGDAFRPQNVSMDGMMPLRTKDLTRRPPDPRSPQARRHNEWYAPDAGGRWVLHQEDRGVRCAYRGAVSPKTGEFLPDRDWERPYALRTPCEGRLATCGHQNEWSWHASIIEHPLPELPHPLAVTTHAPNPAPFALGQAVTVVRPWGGKHLDRLGTITGYSPDGRYVVVSAGASTTVQVLPMRLRPAKTPHHPVPHMPPVLTPRERQLEEAVDRGVHTRLRQYQKRGDTCPWPPTFPLLFYDLPYESAAAREWDANLLPDERCRLYRQGTGRPPDRPRTTPYPGCTFLYPRPTRTRPWRPATDYVWGEEWVESTSRATDIGSWVEQFGAPATWRETNWVAVEFYHHFPWGIPCGLVSAWHRWVEEVSSAIGVSLRRAAWRQEAHDQVSYVCAERAAEQRAHEEAAQLLQTVRITSDEHAWPQQQDIVRTSSPLPGRPREAVHDTLHTENAHSALSTLLSTLPGNGKTARGGSAARLSVIAPEPIPAPGGLWPNETGLWVSTKEAARILGVSAGRVRVWRSRLPHEQKADRGERGNNGTATRLDAVLDYASDPKRLAHQPKSFRTS